jgi:hypothetical protein
MGARPSSLDALEGWSADGWKLRTDNEEQKADNKKLRADS